MPSPSDRSARSTMLLWVLLAICLVGSNLWAISKWRAAQQRLDDGRDELIQSQQYVAEIVQLSMKPKVASLDTPDVTRMTNLVNNALDELSISRGKRTQQDTGLPNKKGDSYEESLTDIKLIELTMPEVIRFCQKLEAPDQGLVVRGLHLVASKLGTVSESDLWDLTVTLSQLVYSAPDVL